MNKIGIAISTAVAVSIIASVAYSSIAASEASNAVRIGYFPNISHAQALVAIHDKAFEEALGNINIEYRIFSAGPSAMEALLTNQVDITYVGPGPAINAYLRTDGEGLKVIAGAASGGALFIVRSDANIQSVKDLEGKKLITPQYGNTQDISLKSYLAANNLKLAEYGGNVYVLHAKGADTLTLFLKKEVDGAWVPEPWGTILVKNGNGKIFLDERDLWPEGEFATTLLVARTEFLEEHPDIVKKILQAHVETTLWMQEHPEEAQQKVRDQLATITGKELPQDIIQEAFSKLKFTYSPMESSITQFAENAYELGMLEREQPDLTGIYYAATLNEVLQEKNLLR